MSEIEIDMRRLADEIDHFRRKHGIYVSAFYPHDEDYFGALVVASRDNEKFLTVTKLQTGEYRVDGGLE